MCLTTATLKELFWFLRSRIPSYRQVSKSYQLNEPEPTRLPAVFFVYRGRDYAQR